MIFKKKKRTGAATPDPKNPPRMPLDVLYLCDRQKCKKCTFPNCKHTSDVFHAENFKGRMLGGRLVIIEKESI